MGVPKKTFCSSKEHELFYKHSSRPARQKYEVRSHVPQLQERFYVFEILKTLHGQLVAEVDDLTLSA